MPGSLNDIQRHGGLFLVRLVRKLQRQLSHLQRLEHHEQWPLVVSLHVGPHHPRDSLRQLAAHCFGVCASIFALHLKLLPGLFVPVWPHGGAGGHAPSHAQRAVRGLGTVARFLPDLALLRHHVLQRVHPQLVRDQPGPLPLHHLTAALQAEDDPCSGSAPGRGCLGVGGLGFLSAHWDEMAQLGPLEQTVGSPRAQRRQYQLLRWRLVPGLLLSAVAIGRPFISVPPTDHPALCPGSIRADLLSAIHRYLLHLLSNPAGGTEAGEEGRSTEPPAVPLPLARGTFAASILRGCRRAASARPRWVQPSGASRIAKRSGKERWSNAWQPRLIVQPGFLLCKLVGSDAKRSRPTPSLIKCENKLKDELTSLYTLFRKWVSFNFVVRLKCIQCNLGFSFSFFLYTGSLRLEILWLFFFSEFPMQMTPLTLTCSEEGY